MTNVTDYKVVNRKNNNITLSDNFGDSFTVTKNELFKAIIRQILQRKIYACDGNIFSECIFWTDDVVESNRFKAYLENQGIGYKFDYDCFCDGDIKYCYTI